MKPFRYALAGIVTIAFMLAIAAFVRMHITSEQTVSAPIPERSPANSGIVVDQPLPKTLVSSPIEVSGSVTGGGWFFEGVFPVRLVNSNGDVLVSEPASALSDWMSTGTIAFKASVSYGVATDTPLTLVLHNDNESGLPQFDKEVRIPIVLKGMPGQYIKTYWQNNEKNPGAMDCSLVFSTERFVPTTQTPARQALEQLLGGPTMQEQRAGYSTSVNRGVTIKKISIQNGTAYVDFDATLEQGVAGSCRVISIRSQITKTLEQFAAVKSVVISIDGRVEDILQP